jgi:MFS family permease
MLGCWQVGSAAGKLALKPLLPKRINPLTELTAWLVVLAATGVLLSFAPNFPLMCVFIVAAGIPVAASYGVLNLQVGTFAKPRVLEGNSVTNTGMLAGVSLGAAGCGVFVDHHGPRATFCVAAVVAALTATLAAGCRPWLTRRAAAIRRESYERGEPIALHHVWSHPVVGDFLGPPIEAGASKFLALVVSRNATARDRVLPELGNLGLRIVGVDPSRLRPRYADMEETVILMRPSRQVAAVVPLQDRSVRPVAVQAIGEWPMAQ